MTVNDDLHDQSIRHQVGLQRLSSGIVKRMLGLLSGIDQRLAEKLLKHDPTAVAPRYAKSRLDKLFDALGKVQKEAYRRFRKEFETELRALAAYEAEFQERMITQTLPIKVDFEKPSPAQLIAAVKARPFNGRHLWDWYAGLEQGAQRRIREAIQTGFVEGETIDQIIRRVRGTRAGRYTDGVLQINRRGAEMVVRTALNHTANVARNEVYQANSDVIKGVRWVSTLDSRTCFVAGTLIETPSGLRAIETLKPGEMVIGGSRRVRQITATTSARKTTMARVTLSTSETVVCTADHMFLTHDGEWREPRQLRAGERLANALN